MFRFLTAGESHGQCLTALVEGIPAGLKINLDEINRQMARRQKGYGRGARMSIETDKVDIWCTFWRNNGRPYYFACSE